MNYGSAVIDTDIHHLPANDGVYLKYFPERTRELAEAMVRNGMSFRPIRTAGAVASQLFNDKFTGRVQGSAPEGGRAGSSYEFLRDQLLDKYDIYRGLLTHDVGEFGCHFNPYFAADLCRAANDWTIEEWLPLDERLYTGIVVSPLLADEAVAEIHRLADHPRMAFVLFAGNPLGYPFGHPLYHPIYAAAAEVGLPIGVHLSGTDHPGLTAPGGRVSTLVENGSLMGLCAPHHLSSLLVHGVFEKFPSLQMLMIEYTLSWLPTVLANLERDYDLLRMEAPLLKRRPTEYVHDHMTFSTQPLEAGRPEDGRRLVSLLETVDGIEDLLCFSSDYPHWTMDDASFVKRTLPRSWHSKVFCENACRVLGWTPPAVATPQTERAVA